MSRRKPDVYLQDILESIGHIQRFLEGVSEDEFYKNVEKQDAVVIPEQTDPPFRAKLTPYSGAK